MTFDDLVETLHLLKEEQPDIGGLPVVLKDTQYGEHEVDEVAVETPYTGIGRWVMVSW